MRPNVQLVDTELVTHEIVKQNVDANYIIH